MPPQIVRKLIGGRWRTAEAEEDGGGGSQAVTGASCGASGTFANSAILTYASTHFDSDSFANEGTGIFTVPAGKGGIYTITCWGEVTATGLHAIYLHILIGGNADNGNIPGSGVDGSTFEMAGSIVRQLDDGDTVKARVQGANDSGDYAFSNGYSGMSVVRLGDTPA